MKWILSMIITIPGLAWAQEDTDFLEDLMSAERPTAVSKPRTYPGGSDEQELTVRPQILVAPRSPDTALTTTVEAN